MKVSVKTLKGNHFDVVVSLSDTVMAVKKRIEDSQGKETFPCSQQLLIYKGKVLKDETTMEENSVTENSFLVVMLTKTKSGAAGPSASGSSTPASAPFAPEGGTQVSATTLPPAPAPSSASPALTAPAPAAASGPIDAPTQHTSVYEQAASSLVAGSNLEETVQQILEMGGGSWDRDTVMRALRAAYNNPERAVDYLYNGIPDAAEVAVPAPWAPAVGPAGTTPATMQTTGAATAAAAGNVPSGGQPGAAVGASPNAAPLDLFPNGMPSLGVAAPGALDFLRTNPQFQALRSMVQANPQILLPMLQELGKQNPQLFRLINENQSEFLRLINDAGAEGTEGDILGQLAEAMPHSVNVTPEEREAIERLEALGFDRARVIEAFLACDRNELMAANYLLEDPGDNEE